MIKKALVVTVLLTTVAAMAMAGCLSNNQQAAPTQNQTSQVKLYANNFLANAKARLGPNETLTSSKLVENGTNAVRLSYTTVNKTASVFAPNGATATYSYNIKKFSNRADATKFYDETSFGYTRFDTSKSPLDPTYRQTTGHDATINNVALRVDSFTGVTSQVSFIMQQDEFVTWGTASVRPK